MRFVLVTLVALLICGCSLLGYEHHQISGAVELYETPNGAQLRVQYLVTGRGNVHNPFSYAKWQFLYFDWIQIERTDGISLVEGDVMLVCPLGLNKWYGPRKVKGSVDVGGDTVRLDLMVPGYAKPGWEPYQFNGTWPLVRRAGSPTKPENASWNCEPPSN